MNPITRCCIWMCCWEAEEPLNTKKKSDYGTMPPPNTAASSYVEAIDTMTPPPEPSSEENSVIRKLPTNSTEMQDVPLD